MKTHANGRDTVNSESQRGEIAQSSAQVKQLSNIFMPDTRAFAVAQRRQQASAGNSNLLVRLKECADLMARGRTDVSVRRAEDGRDGPVQREFNIRESTAVQPAVFQLAKPLTVDQANAEMNGSMSDKEERSSVKFFHGTDLKTGTELAEGAKVVALGKGEFGGGVYLTHNLHQAAHIADYYSGKRPGISKWAVVEFEVLVPALSQLALKKVVEEEDFEEFYTTVQEQLGNHVESKNSWTMGGIKDKATPYIQHLFAQDGITLLNSKETKRKLVLSGTVGINKAKYLDETLNYDIENDADLDFLDSLEPVKSDKDDATGAVGEDDGASSEDEEEALADAIKACNAMIVDSSEIKAKRYTKASIGRFRKDYTEFLNFPGIIELLKTAQELQDSQK